MIHETPQEESPRDRALRPEYFSDFIGSGELVDQLQVYVQAARERQEALDHVLFHGPPGLGKTTLSRIIARELQTDIVITSAPALERSGDLASILTGLQEDNVLFIDEIHRLRAPVEETLYSAMEDYAIDIVLGQGVGAKTVRLNLPRFTLIGATTRTGLLSSPLYARFGIVKRLDYYSAEELARIVARNARLLELEFDTDGIRELARRSRGTPRICNMLLRRLRDFSQIEKRRLLDENFVSTTLEYLGIDREGLDNMDRRYLKLLLETFSGGPVGLDTLAVSMGEEKETLADVYEPYLIQQGFIMRTPRGRVALEAAYEHMGIPFSGQSGGNQGELF